MKPAAFDYAKPRDLSTAHRLLTEANGSAKIIAGGQSLGPMLNMRLAQPGLLIDVRGIEDLHQVTDSGGGVTFGSCITHAMIEDGEVPDITHGLMREVAANIAYRAVRNCGTIGGSICHADPAADWVSILKLLSTVALVEGPAGRREVPLEQFMSGAYTTVLAEDDVLVGLRIPRLSSRARWGHYKFCRKPGEFAESIGAVLDDPEHGVKRALIGATGSAPHVIDNADFVIDRFDSQRVVAEIDTAGLGHDPYERQLHHTALKRAVLSLRGTP